jgi:hypothetical protein
LAFLRSAIATFLFHSIFTNIHPGAKDYYNSFKDGESNIVAMDE